MERSGAYESGGESEPGGSEDASTAAAAGEPVGSATTGVAGVHGFGTAIASTTSAATITAAIGRRLARPATGASGSRIAVRSRSSTRLAGPAQSSPR
jgi:hypothetical protein